MTKCRFHRICADYPDKCDKCANSKKTFFQSKEKQKIEE